MINMYRAPSYSPELNESIMKFLALFCNDKEVVLQVDLNLLSLRWCDDVVVRPSANRLDVDFYNILSLLVCNRWLEIACFSPLAIFSTYFCLLTVKELVLAKYLHRCLVVHMCLLMFLMFSKTFQGSSMMCCLMCLINYGLEVGTTL